jgi:hypothetical protein
MESMCQLPFECWRIAVAYDGIGLPPPEDLRGRFAGTLAAVDAV